MAVISCERKNFQISIAKLDSGKQNLIQESKNLPQTDQIIFCCFGSTGNDDIIFWIKWIRTKNVAMATKFLTYSQVFFIYMLTFIWFWQMIA